MLYLVISVARYLNSHSSRAASLATKEFIHFLLWAHVSHPSLGLCSTWAHFVSISKGLWKNAHSFLPLFMTHQSSVPLQDGNKIFWGALFVTYMYLMKYLMQRNWARCETLIWGACKSSGLKSSAGILKHPEEPEEEYICQKSYKTFFSLF